MAMGRRVALRFRTVAFIGLCLTVVLEFTLGVAAASATTLIMPDRDALKGVDVVVWGNTSQANGTAYSLDCGDGTAPTAGTVADQSYISRTCNYANVGTFPAKLTVGAEVATAQVAVRDSALLSAFDLRAVKINMAIEDGLRSLYFNQANRAATFGTNMTSWPAFGTNETNSFTALAVLAIQNHGHTVISPATDIYQPVVQNGLNWLFDHAIQRDLTPCNEGGMNPCVGVPAPVNIGLSAPMDGLDGYATPIFAATIGAAAAVAPARTVGAGIGSGNSNFVAGKTYSEVLQRIVNSVAWGQGDGPTLFGWYYNLQAGNASDGSTMGWALLGLENAGAAGAIIPPEVRTRLATTLTNQLNNNGSLDYQGDSNPASTFSNPAKTGIGLQGLAVTGALVSDPRVALATGYLVRNWNAAVDPIDFNCSGGTPTTTNKGCGYAMFNVFKGLRLYGINTLPGIGRPAGPGPIPADDWYADYVDNLLANQHNPTNPTGGDWSAATAPTMGWSCCETNTTGITALAELILAPTAFVAPSNVTLAPATASNPVGSNHTVTATATTAAGGPAPGVTVTFTVLSGPNAGPITCTETGGSTNTTDASGQAKCTYADTKGAGTDQIQASIGTIVSNVVTKIWGGAAVSTSIPTLSEWGLLIMAGLLGVVSLWTLRRRRDRTG
jgi:hypothetical protein